MSLLPFTLFIAAAFSQPDELRPLPEVRVVRKGDIGILSVMEPEGEHLAADAPAEIWLHVKPEVEPSPDAAPANALTWEIDSNGFTLGHGLSFSLATSNALAVEGGASLSLCTNVGSNCRMVKIAFDGLLPRARGTSYLTVTPETQAAEIEEEKVSQATQQPLSPDEAFKRAARDGRLVLLDFYATWCPPCNLLSAEILDDPADSPLLEAYWIARVDVDAQESWNIKDRYHVRGYPTMVVVTSDGTEVDRQEGYNSEGDTALWLRITADGVEPLEELAKRALAGSPPLSSNEAGLAARRLAAAGREKAARAALKVAGESVEKHIAALILDHAKDEVIWLAEHGRDELDSWIWEVTPEAWKDPKVLAALRPALREAVLTVDPMVGSELLLQLSRATTNEESKTYSTAAAALVRASLTGNPVEDRGRWTTLADLYQAAGAPDEAVELLQRAVMSFPNEFTFHFALASLNHDLGRNEAALTAAQAALTTSYGDTTLRAAVLCAQILGDLDQKDEALKLLDAIEAKAARPADTLDVRTHRYLKELEKTRQELQKK